MESIFLVLRGGRKTTFGKRETMTEPTMKTVGRSEMRRIREC